MNAVVETRHGKVRGSVAGGVHTFTAYPNNGTECARRRPKEVARDGESL
jgi:hypothetical protein